MRNKAWFLKELQSRIAVLEDAEQQDILAEYAQHIDLRVAGGLTEEEAIQDFGDLDQLASEILEAYHVKPAFRSPTAGVKVVSVPDPRPALKRGCAGAGALVSPPGRCPGAATAPDGSGRCGAGPGLPPGTPAHLLPQGAAGGRGGNGVPGGKSGCILR